MAEMAFSTQSFMTPEELLNLLKPYDLEVLWMPLYTGELKEFQTGYGSGGTSIELTSIYGLTGEGKQEKIICQNRNWPLMRNLWMKIKDDAETDGKSVKK